jgi:hypothetical protein
MKDKKWIKLLPVIHHLIRGLELEICEDSDCIWVPLTEENITLLLNDNYKYREKAIKGTWYLDFKYETIGKETIAGTISRSGYKGNKPRWVNAPNYDCDMNSERFVPDPCEED